MGGSPNPVLKYSALTLLFFPFLLPLPPVQQQSGLKIFISPLSNHMMSVLEPVQYQFTPDEIHQLLSLVQADSPVNSTSGSEVNLTVYSVDERKRRRMLSNRESARRSRQRKKRHVEKLNDQLNHLKAENQELKNQLGLLGQQCYYAFSGTDRLVSECMDLQTKLSSLSQILVALHAITPTN